MITLICVSLLSRLEQPASHGRHTNAAKPVEAKGEITVDSAAFLPIIDTPGDAHMISDIEQRKRYIRRIVAFTLWGIGCIMLLVASVIVHFHPGPWPFDLQTTVTLQSLHLWPWVNSSIDFVSRMNDPLPVTIAVGLWFVG